MTEIIVEVGNSHEGSLGIATSMVDMAKSVGAKIIKFQMHIAEFESTPNEPFRTRFSLQDESRTDYWNRVSFSADDWRKLISYVGDAGLEFMCTPFSIEAAKWLHEESALRRWKVGSGDASNLSLIKYLIESGLPVIVSTGLIQDHELKELYNLFLKRGAVERLTLMHCVSKYPVPLDEVSLHLIDSLREICPRVGYSDHSGNIASGLLALTKDIDVLEVHIAPHKLFFGPDTKASLTPEELGFLIQFNESLTAMKSKEMSRSEILGGVESTYKIFRKGLYWNRDKKMGESVNESDLAFKKPESGLSAFTYENWVGKRLARSVTEGEALRAEDFHG